MIIIMRIFYDDDDHAIYNDGESDKEVDKSQWTW